MEDPRYNSVGERWKYWNDLMGELEEWALGYTAEEAERMLLDAGCPATRYQSVTDVVKDEGLKATGGLVEINDGSEKFLIVNNPMRYRNSDVGPKLFVDGIDQRKDEILGGNS